MAGADARPAAAQEAVGTPADSTRGGPRSVVLRPDTTGADTTAGPPVSPLGAFARSLVIPGWGQAAVGRPGRGAFYFTLEAASAFMVVRTQLRLEDARRRVPPDSGLVAARTSQRENWIALAVFWSLMSGVDAWVSAHFWDFEGVIEPPEDGSPGLELRYEVPLRRE